MQNLVYKLISLARGQKFGEETVDTMLRNKYNLKQTNGATAITMPGGVMPESGVISGYPCPIMWSSKHSLRPNLNNLFISHRPEQFMAAQDERAVRRDCQQLNS